MDWPVNMSVVMRSYTISYNLGIPLKKRNWDFRILYNILLWNCNVPELSVVERLMSKFSGTFSPLLQLAYNHITFI